MVKFTISKIVSVLTFMVTFFIFLIWMINYSTDLAIIFGLRTSNVVANDIAGRISSLASVNGEAVTTYIIGSPNTGEQGATYDITITNFLVCVNSLAASTWTSDCASHVFPLEPPYNGKGLTNSKLVIEKFYSTKEKQYEIKITEESI